MTARSNAVLGVALVAQVALVAIVHLAQSKPRVARLEPILELEAAALTKIEIFGRVADAKTPQAEPDIVLTKSGLSWTVSNHFNYPADQSKVDAFVTKLIGMKAREPVATRADRHRQLRVADDKFERRLVITAAGAPTELYLGAAAGRQQTAVRLKGTEKTYGATGITAHAASTSFSSWVDTTYLKLVGPMSSLELAHGETRLALRKVDGAWKRHDGDADVPVPEGKELDTGSVESIASSLLNMQLTRAADPAKAGFTPRATATFAAADGAAHTLKVGEEKDGETLIVIDDKVPVWVSSTALSALLELTGETLYRDPPDPAAAPVRPPGNGLPPGMIPPGMMPPGAPR